MMDLGVTAMMVMLGIGDGIFSNTHSHSFERCPRLCVSLTSINPILAVGKAHNAGATE